jgi:hypothetical protein
MGVFVDGEYRAPRCEPLNLLDQDLKSAQLLPLGAEI